MNKREEIKNFLKEVLTGLEEHDELIEIKRKVMVEAIGLGDYIIKNTQSNHPLINYEFKKAVKKFEKGIEKAFNL
jgi:hypothetical protein